MEPTRYHTSTTLISVLLTIALSVTLCIPYKTALANNAETSTSDIVQSATGEDSPTKPTTYDDKTTPGNSPSDSTTSTDNHTPESDVTSPEVQPTVGAVSIRSAKPSYNAITITWTKSANAQKYAIYRSKKKASGYKLIKTINSAKTLSYKDPKLTLGKTYYYKIRAYNEDVYKQSAVKSARVQPAQISTCTVKSQDYRTIKISWNKVSGSNGYYLYQSTKKNGSYKKVKTLKKGSLTSCKITGLTSGKTYYYKVCAYRTAHGKKYCGSKSSAFAGKALPKKATITKANHSSGKVNLAWKTVSGASGYQVYRSTSKSSGFSAVKTTSKATRTWKNSGLSRGKTYYYKVRAFRTVKGKKIYGSFSSVKKVTVPLNKWDKLLNTYRTNKSVNQLVFVKYQSGSKATVYVYDKQGTSWKNTLKCKGYVGEKGINKVREGDRKTPTGTFGILGAFGIKAKPTTSLKYTKANRYLYWCGDKKYYNRLIDVRKQPHKCHGEHLIDYKRVYDYGLFLDYNPKKTYKKGSAIFMHCSGSYGYTGGCVAVSKSNMLKILKTLESGAKVCIYPA